MRDESVEDILREMRAGNYNPSIIARIEIAWQRDINKRAIIAAASMADAEAQK